MPDELDKLDALVAERRKALSDTAAPVSARVSADTQHLWGLALSGGGIRSATFCFGLLQALAQHRLLLRFDLLSTVSGGGYIGSMIGRLFGKATTAQDVLAIEYALGHANRSWMTWWLRANGRYLVPRAGRDFYVAAASYLRNMAGVHIELGLVCLLLGALLCGINLLVWSVPTTLLNSDTMPTILAPFLDAHFPGWRADWAAAAADFMVWIPPWLPTLWLIGLPICLLLGVIGVDAYWLAPQLTNPTGRVWRVTIHITGWVVFLVVLAYFHDSAVGSNDAEARTFRQFLVLTSTGLALCWLIALPVCLNYLRRSRGRAPHQPSARCDEVRNRITRGLSVILSATVLVITIGIVERLAWTLAFEPAVLAAFGAALAVAATAIRAAFPQLTGVTASQLSQSRLLLIGRIAGYLAVLVLAVVWVAVAQKTILGALFRPVGLQYQDAWTASAWLALPVFGYLAITSRNFSFLNASSLHTFYRARLVRSYLGAVNADRFAAAAPLGALDTVPDTAMTRPNLRAVDRVDAGDDVLQADYAPHRLGGPVHLINVCINQTRDPRSGLHNQDRRGLPLTVAPKGLIRVGAQPWETTADHTLTLGSWVSISGAAASPGMGMLTRGGLSALAMFAGVRLGYWWQRRGATTRRGWFGKSRGLLAETLGVFRGIDEPYWFLTDGGHFENTGAYALLAKRCRVVVVADCGADPDYGFGDLENLVRKARIDLHTEIEFVKPRPAAITSFPAFGSLADLAQSGSEICLALARIRYPESSDVAWMLVVKPNMSSLLPADLVNFKIAYPEFPQQSTADQFFDESQWESYSQLGLHLGRFLTPELFEQILANAAKAFVADDGCPIAHPNNVQARAEPPVTPTAESPTPAPATPVPNRWQSRVGTATVTASLGLGAAATIGVSVWQAIDSARARIGAQDREDRASLTELSNLWAKMPAGCLAKDEASAAGLLAGALVRVSDIQCPDGGVAWFKRSPLAARIRDDSFALCESLPGENRPIACVMLLTVAGNSCLFQPARRAGGLECNARYWAIDYAGQLQGRENCGIAVNIKLANNDEKTNTCTRAAAPLSAGDGTTGKTSPQVVNSAATTPATTSTASPGPSSATTRPTTPRSTGAPASASVSAPTPAATAVVDSGSSNSSWETMTVYKTQKPTTSTGDNSPSPSTTNRSATQPVDTPCKGLTLYVQIYGQDLRDDVRLLRDPWRGLGASVPPIEDVRATASRAGRPAPRPVDAPTLRYHSNVPKACLDALATTSLPWDPRAWKIQSLPTNLTPQDGVVEVWIPPKDS